MKKVLVVGYGISGRGAAKLLKEKGYTVSVYSDKPLDALNEDVTDVSSLSEFEAVADKEFVVVSPGVDCEHKIVRYAARIGVPVIGELELGYRYCKGKIVAVTGTNGKTTTTKLLGEIVAASGLKTFTLGNIGNSFCEYVSDIPADGVAVLEVSSFQLETIKDFCPRVAACLNITPDHYERHKNFENYSLQKFKIFINQKDSDFAVLNYDDPTVRDFCDGIKSQVYFVSTKMKVRGCYIEDGKIMVNINDTYALMGLEDVPLKGDYNYQNVLTAVAASKLIGVDDDAVVAAVKDFRLPRFRNELIATVDGKNYFNDSKATNIDSTLKACASMSGDTALIVGGYDKGISYEGFFSKLPACIKHIVATGDNVYTMMSFLPPYREYTFEITSSLERAVELASQKQVENVLFSPTTSSFDRYSGYEERGEHFDMIVKSISK